MGLLQRAGKVGRKYVNPIKTAVGGLGTIFKILPMYLTNKEERVPKVAIGPFVTDTSVYQTAPASGLRVTWFGHSSTLIEIDGTRVLIDPVWDERASPVSWGGPKRFYAPTLRLEDLPEIDVVLISHDHYDHLGRKSVEQLAALQSDARWVTSLGVGELLRAFGVAAEKITELNWTESVAVGSLNLTALPARHFSGRSLSNRFETLWSSFVLKGTEHSVYYGADTGWWDGFAEIGADYGPFDLTLIEIGAFNEMWKDIHIGPDGAVKAFEAMNSGGFLMPIHWGLFDLALHGWRQPIERMYEVAAERGTALWSPQPGKPVEVVRGQQVRADWWRR
ncbi:MBL fold metallo-hydrolase [Granulicella arctica]|uniref:MBL fold metallo-hydrolase n=1 Tax=Granulicella arctica TaxID=940613 RepID=UPI0021DFE26C|nr:MBL fold metallo-hydrolase [Granulicella arctica]